MKQSHVALVLALAAAALVHAAPRVAIVGGGVGGASAAFFLKELVPDAEITVFESAPFVGGRVQTIRMGERDIETGGSVIHDKNQHAVRLAQQFGLNITRSTYKTNAFAIYDGENIVHRSSEWKVMARLCAMMLPALTHS